MEPREARFTDARRDRFAHWPQLRLPACKAQRTKLSIACAAEFKAARLDRRFALPALGYALERAGSDWTEVPASFTAPFASHLFSRTDSIPRILYALARGHASLTAPGKIACYPTRADALRNREVVLSPGKFFAACMPGARPAVVQQWAEEYQTAHAPLPLHFAKEADDWACVYASGRGFTSCMANWNASDPHHPVRFYAHPDNDLFLAYITHCGEPGGAVVARSIVNKASKAYVRVYGDQRLALALEALGFTCDADAALDGQQCRVIEHKGSLVVPFLDNRSNIKWKGSQCWIDGSGSISGENTNGLSRDPDDYRDCEHCGDETEEDDTVYAEHTEETICQHCADQHYTYAIFTRHGAETYVPDRDVVTVGGVAYLDDDEVLNAHNIVRDEDGDAQDLDDCIYLLYLEEYVLHENCTALDVPFGEDTYARTVDTVTNDDGQTVHKEHDHAIA